MDEELAKFIYGAIGGGLVALLFRVTEKYWLDKRFIENQEARTIIKKYSNPLWLDCHELKHRLLNISEKVDNPHQSNPLNARFDPENPIEWYTKEGYYLTSTAYLVASVSAWIRILQRDVVIMKFKKESQTVQFFQLVENLKKSFSANNSILWYHYFNGIGEGLIKDKTPLTFYDFVDTLNSDAEFCGFYDQLFQFLNALARSENYKLVLNNVMISLDKIKVFLEKNDAVPELSK